MPEKKRCRTFLSSTLQALRTTFNKHINSKTRRKCPNSTPVMQNKSASMPGEKYLPINSTQTSTLRSTRTISTPNHHGPNTSTTTTHEHEHMHQQKHRPDQSPQTPRVTKTLRIRRLTSRFNPVEAIPSIQTSVGHRMSVFASRLPTPTEPPKDERYSHSIYQNEGRRSALSALGRRWAMRTSNVFESRTRPPMQNDGLRSRPFILRRRTSSQYKDDSAAPVETRASSMAATLIGKERPGRDSSNRFLMPRYYVSRNRLESFDTAREETTQNKMASPRRIRLSRGFEDLKTQEPQRTRLPMPSQPSTSPHSPVKPIQDYKTPRQSDLVKENDAPAYHAPIYHATTLPQQYRDPSPKSPKRANEPGSKLPVVSPSSSRRKIQVEKMVLKPPPPRHSAHTPRVSAAPSCVSVPKRRPILTGHMDGRPQVETAMPEAYWLGRFMTLTNAFHYEESFNQPDIATGFEMLSSYCRPFQGSDDGDVAGYRVKRAFMVLENLCVTEEANESLGEFRDAYNRRFGGQWME